MSKIRKIIRSVLEESFIFENIESSQKQRLTSILNSLEFKNDVINSGGEIYAVGGIVRDAIMGTPSDDLDIVIRGIPYDKLFGILSKYGTAKDTSHVDENGKKDFGSTKFVSKNEEFNKFLEKNGVVSDIDIMLPRKDQKDPGIKGHKGIKSDVNHNYTIYDDLDRRDITINAIAMNLNGDLITNGTGIEDIKNGIIKAVNEDAFIEDPIRLLRSVRLSARYNFDFDPSTINLIKDNAKLLSDKDELPRERFLMEFKKMIGKSDLGRAVKLTVDLGLYESIFGIKPKIQDYKKFDMAHNVGEMAFMMFDQEPLDSILPLIESNITNDNYILNYAKALVEYKKRESKITTKLEKVLFLSRLYKISSDALLESIYISKEDKEIANKFKSGELPKDEHDLKFKGEEFKNYIVSRIVDEFGEFIPKRDGIKMGKAKQLILYNIYDGTINNDVNSIKNILEKNKLIWMY